MVGISVVNSLCGRGLQLRYEGGGHANLEHLAKRLDDGYGVFTYDGYTPSDARKAIRERGHIVLSNPDMLHTGILPHHTKWMRLFEFNRAMFVSALSLASGIALTLPLVVTYLRDGLRLPATGTTNRVSVTGIFDALNAKIARPIGMQDYRPQDGAYVRGDASFHPAYPIRMSARDLARFALLYLRKGNWAGRQIVPQAWVQESTQAYSRSPFGLGYGYLWWTDFLDGNIAPTVTLPEGNETTGW